MLPQVIKMIKERSASQVSLIMMMILILGITLWVVYGIMKADIPIIASNAFALLINFVMVFLRYLYRNNVSSTKS